MTDATGDVHCPWCGQTLNGKLAQREYCFFCQMKLRADDQCDAMIRFGDDYGDNTTTFHCQLAKGHGGDHRETGMMDGSKDYCLTWRDDNGDAELLRRLRGEDASESPPPPDDPSPQDCP
jgi:hypothetical protein